MLGLVISLGSLAQDSGGDSLLISGNTSYENGEFEEAIYFYEQIEQEYVSPALYRNLGNSHFRSGNIAHAILNYERSLKLDPGNEDLEFNLAYVKNLIKDKLEENESDQLSSFLKSISTSFPANTWALISIVFAFLFFISMIFVFSVKKVSSKRSFFYITGLFGVLLLSSIYFAYDSKKIMITHSHAIITDPKVDVKSEPKTKSIELFVLHEGSKVIVLGSKNGWIQIQLPNGTKGWLPIETLEKI